MANKLFQSVFALLLFATSVCAETTIGKFTICLGNDTATCGKLIVYPAEKCKSDSVLAGVSILICPGGGYSRLVMANEGYDWVEYFKSMGITVAILKYSMPHGVPSVPVADAEKGIRMMRDSATAWRINPNRIGIMGFSAGGHLASIITTSRDTLTRPNFSLLMYPVITMSESFMHKRSHKEFMGEKPSREIEIQYSADKRVDESTPPVFLALSNDDRNVNPLNSLRFYEAMLTCNRPCSMHVYHTGRHGWGFNKSFAFHDQMLDEVKQWLKHLLCK